MLNSKALTLPTLRAKENESMETENSSTIALTRSNSGSRRCRICGANIRSKPRGNHGRYCSARCRLDAYSLLRAKVISERLGVEEFRELLGKV
jgi:hypothetical protein